MSRAEAEIRARVADNFRELGNDEWRNQYRRDVLYLLEQLAATQAEMDKAKAAVWKQAILLVESLKCAEQFEGNWRNGYSHAQNDAFRALEAAAAAPQVQSDVYPPPDYHLCPICKEKEPPPAPGPPRVPGQWYCLNHRSLMPRRF